MTKMSISSQFCNYNHRVSGKMDRDKIIVEIDTPCEKFSGISRLELPFMEISDTREKRIIELAKGRKIDCSQECPITYAILNIYNIETGFADLSEKTEKPEKNLEDGG